MTRFETTGSAAIVPFGRVAIALSYLLAAAAHASVFTVGGDGDCAFATIQAAVSAAASTPGHDVVRIARNGSYVHQAIGVSVQLNQELTIEGGYETCSSPFDGNHTVVRGTGDQWGGSAVFAIFLNPGARVHMRHLHIQQGRAAHGGGIHVENAPSGGASGLDIADTLITDNVATSGGGIHAWGGDGLELTIGSNVLIAGNLAQEDGGGVFLGGDAHLIMTAPNTAIASNLAGLVSEGGGGGLMVVDGATAQIGGAGDPFYGALSYNEADYGAGIAVGTRGHADSLKRNHGRVIVRAADPAAPPRIHRNLAHQLGGAFYLGATDGSGAIPRIDVADVNIDSNHAQTGAVLAVDGEAGSNGFAPGFSMNVARLVGAVKCAAGAYCNGIRYNASAGRNPLISGAHADIEIRSAIVQDNQGGALVAGMATLPASSRVTVADSLITDNQFLSGVLSITGSGSTLRIRGVTVANNVVADPAGVVLRAHGEIALERSILWQPGTALLETAPGTAVAVRDLLVSDLASLGGGTERVISAPPRFIDSDNAISSRRDYHLHASSPAVDFAAAAGGLDLDGQPRDRDLPLKPDRDGTADLGAYERQSMLPLVRNGGFDRVLDSWQLLASAGIAFDPLDDAPGSGGGSLHFGQEGSTSRFEVARQCVFLPGPQVYRLNGWGRTTETSNPSTRDAVLLHWELRLDGGEECDGGAADLQGDHLLSDAATWRSPAAPAYIDANEIPAPLRGQWGANASIAITLVVIDRSGSVSHKFGAGWFDGIELEAGGEEIFVDGFEQPAE